MAMNVGSGRPGADPDVMMDINTTPLIDVMLVLLIMFIITIPIQTHAVKLDMPRPNPLVRQASGGPPLGHSFSRPVSVEMPSRFGPRHCGQSLPAAQAVEARRRQKRRVCG